MKLSGLNIFENSGKNFKLNLLFYSLSSSSSNLKLSIKWGEELLCITREVWNDAAQGLGTEELDKHDPNRF